MAEGYSSVNIHVYLMTEMMTRILYAVLAMAVVSGGSVIAGASGQVAGVQADESSPVTNADTVATLDDGTVTLTVTDRDTPVENVTVTVEAENVSDDTATNSDDPRKIGQTDADGIVTFPLESLSRFEVDLSLQDFSGELEYTVTGDSLTLLEEEYEYTDDTDDPDRPDDPGNGGDRNDTNN